LPLAMRRPLFMFVGGGWVIFSAWRAWARRHAMATYDNAEQSGFGGGGCREAQGPESKRQLHNVDCGNCRRVQEHLALR
jgi:hypothetical protein